VKSNINNAGHAVAAKLKKMFASVSELVDKTHLKLII
jgi:hypothetical protein